MERQKKIARASPPGWIAYPLFERIPLFSRAFSLYHAVVLIAYLLSEIFYGWTVGCVGYADKEEKVVWRTEKILIIACNGRYFVISFKD